MPELPAPEVLGVTPPPPHDPASNPAFAQMRTALAEAERKVAEAEARATTLEREKMSEGQRVAAELADAQKRIGELTPLQDEVKRHQEQTEKACEIELSSLPDDKRAAIKAVTDQVPLAGRLIAIQQMRSAVGAPPVSGGSVTQPSADPNGGLPGAPEGAKPMTAAELRGMSLGSAIQSRGVVDGNSALAAEVKALREEIKTLATARK